MVLSLSESFLVKYIQGFITTKCGQSVASSERLLKDTNSGFSEQSSGNSGGRILIFLGGQEGPIYIV